MNGQSKGWIERFAHHRVAANLLMVAMLMVGFWALSRINVQFLPNFDINEVNVDVIWRGASAEDVQRSVTVPLEQELRGLDFVKEIRSSSRLGAANINLEFEEGTNMSEATERVRQRVSVVRNLPSDIEPIRTEKVTRYERIVRLVITSAGELEELRPIVRSWENELLQRGIAKVTITGLPEDNIAIAVPMQSIAETRLSLDQIARIIRQRSQDLPAGTIGRGEIAKQLRSVEQRRTVEGYRQLHLLTDADGQLLRLGDIATIKKVPRDDEVEVSQNGKLAVEMTMFRTEAANALDNARIFHEWLESKRKQIPPSIQLTVYDESWVLIKERINLLLTNGAQGLILILGILFLFLNRHIAFWVSVGIPVSFLAGIAILYLAGDSINMVSLFALIMTLGIIVDDTIVVGEETLSQIQSGVSPHGAVTLGAQRMFVPVMSSSLTTICAFLPLMLITEIIGAILFSIPLVVVSVIIASVIECFLVLPGHLYHSFKRNHKIKSHAIRDRVDAVFTRFRDTTFKRFVERAVHAPMTTLAFAFASFVVSLSLVVAGWVNFNFFPSPDGMTLYAGTQFLAGTPQANKRAFMKELSRALLQTDKELSREGQSLLETHVSFMNTNPLTRQRGEQYAAVAAELLSPDSRPVTNQQFIDAWRRNIRMSSDVETLTVTAPRGGPPGKDIDIRLTGDSVETLKQASLELQAALRKFNGVNDIVDDMPYGQGQLIFQVKPQGRALGFTTENAGRQIRAAFTGEIAQIFHEGADEVEVRVFLPEASRGALRSLQKLPLITPSGEVVLLSDVVSLRFQKGVDVLKRTDTELSVHVTTEVNARVTNSNKVLAALSEKTLPDLVSKYGVKYYFSGRSEEQAETLADMRYGLGLAVALIYVVLAWVFSSYVWPLAVITAVPIGLAGAIFGHLLMGLDLTILSLFGFFGLSGIVINDSIILITRFRELLDTGLGLHEALVEASKQRLRAVMLTSMTTVAGLTPLLFERSLQAQFLIPMATSICFGLAFATLLILVLVPSLLAMVETRLRGARQGG